MYPAGRLNDHSIAPPRMLLADSDTASRARYGDVFHRAASTSWKRPMARHRRESASCVPENTAGMTSAASRFDSPPASGAYTGEKLNRPLIWTRD